VKNFTTNKITKSISANADDPRDADLRPVDRISLQIDVDAECNRQQQASVDIESTLLRRPTAVGCQHTRAR